MASLLKKGLILTVARLTNYLVLLASPIFLVRLLDVKTYGQYREFILYAMALVSIMGFSIPSNLTYVLPKHSNRDREAVTNSTMLLLITSTIGVTLCLIAKNWLLAGVSYDFFLPLLLYVFFFTNFDLVEFYWIGRGEPQHIIKYTASRSLVRVVALVIGAYFSGDIKVLLAVMVCVEVVKGLFLLGWMLRKGLLRFSIDYELLREQWQFALPLGLSSILYFANQRFGQFYISAVMGASALAIYSIGSYQLPVLAVVRSAVADTLFPDMVRSLRQRNEYGLELWKKATLYYFLLILPIFLVLFVYAEVFITTLFTKQYLAATGIFRICLLIMLRQCFELGTPLRAMNANRHFLLGNCIALLISIPIIILLIPVLGLKGAALGALVADILISIYLISKIITLYEISIRQFAYWVKLAKLVGAGAAATPILLMANWLAQDSLWSAAVSSAVFMGLYFWFISIFAVPEVTQLFTKAKTAILVGGDA